MTAPFAVSLHVWRVPRRDLVAAMARLPVLRREARRATGVTFAKVLGTADATFTPCGATITRWALLAAWTDVAASTDFRASPSVRWWEAHAGESACLLMRPVRSRGRWDRRAPFGDGSPGEEDAGAGPVVALTRASLRAGRALRFYRAVPAIAADVARASGLRVAFGVGEAPLLRQGTVSIWDDVHRMQAFARTTAAHAEAVRATPAARWYAEELFARFAIIDAAGTIDGQDVVA